MKIKGKMLVLFIIGGGVLFASCVQDSSEKTGTEYKETASEATYTFPIVFVNTEVETEEITRNSYIAGDFKLLDKNDCLDIPMTKKGIKGRGNSTWSLPKKGYNIRFDTKTSLFGLPKNKKYCLIANYFDKTLVRNRFAAYLGTKIFNRNWNPTAVSVDFVLNGVPMGNYVLSEKISLSSGRIDLQDIAEVWDNLVSGNDSKIVDVNQDGVKNLKDGGFIVEIDVYRDADFTFDTMQGIPVALKDPDNVSQDVFERIKTVIQDAENVLYGEAFLEPELINETCLSKWMKYIDVDSVLDWYIPYELAKLVDAPFITSCYMYYNPATDKLYLGPIWDFDTAFGVCTAHGVDSPEGWWVKELRFGDTPNWIHQMFKDPLFVDRLQSRWEETKNDLYSAINIEVQKLADEIKDSAERNFEIWPILGKEIDYPYVNPDGYEERTTFQSEVDFLVTWLNARYNWLDSAIKGL